MIVDSPNLGLPYFLGGYMTALSQYVVFGKEYGSSKGERMPLANHCSSFCHHALPVTIVLCLFSIVSFKKDSFNLCT